MKIFIICLLVTFNFANAAATDTNSYDLFKIYELASKYDPTLRIAEKQRLADRQVLPEAEAQFLPNISATVDTSANFNSTPFVGRYNLNGYTLNLSQSVLNLSNISRWCEARSVATQADINYEAAKQALLVRVAEGYFAVLSALDDMTLSTSQRVATAHFLDQTDQRYQAGLIAITDVYEAQARLDNAKAQELAFENAYKNSLEELQQIVGVKVNALRPLRENIPLHGPIPANIDQWVDFAIHKNLELQAAKFGVASVKQQIITNCNDHYPTVDIRASYGRNSNPPPFFSVSGLAGDLANIQRSTTGQIGLFMTIPIFSGGSVVAKTRQARYKYEVEDHKLMKLYRSTVSDTRKFYRGVITNIDQVKALERTVFSSKSALDATKAGFDAGTRTIVDVLDSQTRLTIAKGDYARARYNYLLETLRLKQSSGGLSPNDLYVINYLLKPHCCGEPCEQPIVKCG